MTHRRWLIFSLVVFVLSAGTAIYLGLQNSAIKQARSNDDAVNSSNSNKQPVSFLVYPGEWYNTCSANTGAPEKLGAAPPTPAPIETGAPDGIAKSLTVGDVLQVTIGFACAFNDASAVADMRANKVQFKPGISALDFDVAPVMADELDGRNFYCVAAPDDSVCKNGSTTPVQDLKWTWFLRPRSVGRHFVRIDIYQRKIIGPGQYVEIAPRWVREYSIDVRQPFTNEIAQWAPVIATLAALFPAITFIHGLVARSRQRAGKE
ncbi:MAG: hypothetical protein WB609_00610 [Candidatus Cybelea sp.]